MDGESRPVPSDIQTLLARMQRDLQDVAHAPAVAKPIEVLAELEAHPLSADVLADLQRETFERHEHAQNREQWLIGAAAALLDDAAETEAQAVPLGWTRTEARAHLEHLRAQPGGLSATTLRIAHLDRSAPVPKAPAITGFVLYDLESRLARLGGKEASPRLGGHVSCARGLREQALSIEDQLAVVNSSPGATVVRLRDISRRDHDVRLSPVMVESLCQDCLRLIAAVWERTAGVQPGEPAGVDSESTTVGGTAPSSDTTARNASPRAA
jgi:hypothetical protein